ncbi:MAG: hypothetical protein U0744_21905 [Gemmataceae bacterium]
MPHAPVWPGSPHDARGEPPRGDEGFLEDLHPATIAETLSDELTVEQTWKFLENTGLRHQAAIFEYFPTDWQIQMAEAPARSGWRISSRRCRTTTASISCSAFRRASQKTCFVSSMKRTAVTSPRSFARTRKPPAV